MYPVQVYSASFSDVRLLYASEKESLAKLAPNLTIKACFLSAIERQNVKLVLQVFNELTLAALKLQNELSNQEYRNNTHNLVEILWKLFNINSPLKGKRLNDDMSRPLTYQDEEISFLACVVIWLETWLALPGNVGKLSKQTFTSFKHACIVLPQITNHLTGFCGFNYLLTSFLQTDPLEHHFGLYRMMSVQTIISRTFKSLKLKPPQVIQHIKDLCFTTRLWYIYSIQTFIESYSSLDTNNGDDMDVQLVLMKLMI